MHHPRLHGCAIQPGRDDDRSEQSEDSTDDSDLPQECCTDLEEEPDVDNTIYEDNRPPQKTALSTNVANGRDETLADVSPGFVHSLVTEEIDEGKPSSILLV